MKKISLSLLIIGLTYSLFSFSNTDNSALKRALAGLNKYWNNVELTSVEYQLPESETELIQLHLKLVNQVLIKKDINHLTSAQKLNRIRLLKELKTYEKKGIFPINSYHDERTPYFIDEVGTACAVGQLIIKSGYEELATSISEKFNYLYIEDMPQEPITNWAKKNGFTVEELKWIQPGYGPQCQPGQVIQPNCASGQWSSGCFNPDWQGDGLIPPLRYLTEINIGNGYRVDSFNLWQWQGAYLGQYRITITDSLSTSRVYNYTIVAPPPILSNDSIIQHASSSLSCNGILSVNPTLRNGHYRITLMNQNLLYSKTNTSGLFDSLCPAIYTILIYDTLNCQTVDSANIQLITNIKSELIYEPWLEFQNPTIGDYLQLSTNLKGNKQIQLIDLTGKIIKEFRTNQNEIVEHLNVKGGLYFVKVSNGKQVLQKKIIISN